MAESEQRRKRLFNSRDVLEEELNKQLELLNLYVDSSDRRSKVEKTLSTVTTILQKITEKITQLYEVTNEDMHETLVNWAKSVNDNAKSVSDRAIDYVRRIPTDIGAPSSQVSVRQKSKASDSGKSKTKTVVVQNESTTSVSLSSKSKHSKLEQCRLKARLRQEEIERQGAAEIEFLKKQAHLDLQRKEEEVRQKVQAALNDQELIECEIRTQSSASQTKSHVDFDYIEQDFAQEKVETWIDKSAATVEADKHAKSSKPTANPIYQANVSKPDRILIQPQPQNHPDPYLRQCLPKWELKAFDGDPLEWPEWKGLFMSTIGMCGISNEDKMNDLKTTLTGRAKITISRIAYGPNAFSQSWDLLEKKFGQPHIIVSAHLEKLSRHPPVKQHNSSSIMEYALMVSSIVNVFRELGYDGDLQSSSNLQTIVSKLPPNLRERWCSYVITKEIYKPDLLKFDSWFQTIADTHERLLMTSGSNIAAEKHEKFEKVKSKPTHVSAFTASAIEKCVVCNGTHKIWACPTFKEKTPTERAEVVKEKRLCFCCLLDGHSFRKCPKSRKCGIEGCTKLHNRLLHNADKVFPVKNTHFAKKSYEDQTTNLDHESSEKQKNLKTYAALTSGLLQIVKIRIQGKTTEKSTLALCDTGSTNTWIDEDFAKILNIHGEKTTIMVNSLQKCNPLETEVFEVHLSSVGVDEPVQFTLQAYSKKGLSFGTDKLDMGRLKKKWKHLSCLKDEVFEFSDVKMLLGQDSFPIIRPLEYRYNKLQEPWAVRLPLGWVLSGPLPKMLQEKCDHASSSYKALVSQESSELTDQVRKWWELESYASSCNVESRSKEDKRALEILERSTQHNGNRYSTGLLWIEDDSDLPNNYAAAYSQLLTLEKRLNKDDELKRRYIKTINDDIEKGYMKEITKEELQSTREAKQWYLPHHPVINPNKPEKVRRVCNAASKFHGTSLNDQLLVGPDLLNSLIGILLRFRERKYAFAADIEAKFLQIEVPPDDQRCLRILWREDSSLEMKVYQYTRHVFGSKDSPTAANYILQRTAKDNYTEFPDAAKSLLRDFYMDDILKSTKTIDEAVNLSTSLILLLRRGGFKLCKWISNTKEILDRIPENNSDSTEPSQKSNEAHVLGLQWNTETDKMIVSRGTQKEMPTIITQRSILAFVSSVFDPIGMVAPFTIKTRLLLKNIWKTRGQQWDNPIEDDERNEFLQWASQLNDIRNVTLPRTYFMRNEEPLAMELHLFSDASLEAMCAVVYLRATFEKDVEVSFVIGKARVAPMKQHSIPKLELQSAVMSARLSKLVKEEIQLPIDEMYFWSDNSTTLQWINSSHKKQPVFVANRVAEILELSTVEQWRHVPGEMNPADCGTRGLSPDECRQSMWLAGPSFLLLDKDHWPSTFAIQPEQEVIVNVCLTEKVIIKWECFSSYVKILRVLVIILRFCRHLLNTRKPATTDELMTAKAKLWTLVQRDAFSQELADVSKGTISSKSPIGPMSPFIGSDGLLRAKGRLRKLKSMDFGSKHPIILSGKHPAVKLYLKYIHLLYHHEGVEYLRSIIQQELWITQLRSALRLIKNSCILCQKLYNKPIFPEMADLPIERLDNKTFCFANTGVDYFGPIQTTLARRTFKRWGFLFTCMTTRAVHIEICHSMSADSCVLAIRRFIARRGQPKVIVSDNGTNFIAAEKELRTAIENWNKTEIATRLAQSEINWKFNPPGAPHFGGVWERIVRSCKRAMYNIIGTRRLTDEVLQTVMCLVEQTLNSRPLTPVSSDPEDLEALTPNHFLLGRPTVSLPSTWTSPNDICHKKAFKQAEAYTDLIWKRWLKEYIPNHNQRVKWTSSSNDSINVGDLVWMREPSVVRGYFPLGRIVEVYRGDDLVVRSAKVKTKFGSYVRPLVKLVPLNL